MWTDEEIELYKEILGKQSVDTGINVFDHVPQAVEEAQDEGDEPRSADHDGKHDGHGLKTPAQEAIEVVGVRPFAHAVDEDVCVIADAVDDDRQRRKARFQRARRNGAVEQTRTR